MKLSPVTVLHLSVAVVAYARVANVMLLVVSLLYGNAVVVNVCAGS